VAISRGQAEKLHLDLNDDNAVYTRIMVLGNPGKLWDSSRHQGHLYLPTFGVMALMTVGDMVFFNASELPHLVVKLDEADKHKRTIITTFTSLRWPTSSTIPQPSASLGCDPEM
jgi:hypothetical protein